MDTATYQQYKAQLEAAYKTAMATGTVYEQESVIYALAMLDNAYDDNE